MYLSTGSAPKEQILSSLHFFYIFTTKSSSIGEIIFSVINKIHLKMI
ncbi:hypothetical protein J3D55_002666 [Chryseobacterium ginsenosidimutans]|nr:hypothetical protein [Chryseobacterium ginsenosidimutans]MCS3869750.1 hypothetical protein [Chryseobacterium ginsenosidimutans]